MCEVCALNEVTLVVIMWQDVDDGGISERPGNMADIFHTYFGVAGLALLGHLKAVGAPYEDIDPAYALPVSLVAKLGVTSQSVPAPKVDAPGADS